MNKKLKGNFKKISLVYLVNAFLKKRTNSRKMRWLYKYYSEKARENSVVYDEGVIIDQVRNRLRSRGIKPKIKPKGDLRIFWVGGHYEQDNSGFLQSLKSFGEVIPLINDYNGYNPKKWISSSSIEKEDLAVASQDFLNQVMVAHQKKPIDVLLGQIGEHITSFSVLESIQKLGIPVINISMDDKITDRWLRKKKQGYVSLTKGIDLVLTTSPDTCLWYLIENAPAIYWPLASNPDIFYPREHKIYDVVFVGGNYGLRGKLVKKIRKAGIKIEVFGPGFPNGFINAVRMSEVFGQAKIILGSGHVGYNEDIFTLKLRDFDATMSGSLYITNRNPDLLQLFKEDKEIECYNTFDECISKIKFYLANPDRLEVIANAGLKKARDNHTWNKNFEKAFKIINLI